MAPPSLSLSLCLSPSLTPPAGQTLAQSRFNPVATTRPLSSLTAPSGTPPKKEKKQKNSATFQGCVNGNWKLEIATRLRIQSEPRQKRGRGKELVVEIATWESFFALTLIFTCGRKHFSSRSSVICDDGEILMPNISSGGSGGKKNVLRSRQGDAQKEESEGEKNKYFVNAAASVLWSSEWEASGLVGSQPPADTSCLILTSKTDFVRQGRGWGGGGVGLGGGRVSSSTLGNLVHE